jgi:hypothetical protein
MDEVQKQLHILIDYWIAHNSEHMREFRDWADKVASSSAEVAQQLQAAATKMAVVSAELAKARVALSKNKERH